MKILFTLVFSALLASGVHAAPLEKGDPAKGKALHNKSCTSCHISMLGGNGSEMYTRADHKTKTAQQLAARISGVGFVTVSERRSMGRMGRFNHAWHTLRS